MNCYRCIFITFITTTVLAYGNDNIIMGIPASGPTIYEHSCPCELKLRECHCMGPGFMDIPSSLPKDLEIL